MPPYVRDLGISMLKIKLSTVRDAEQDIKIPRSSQNPANM